MNHYLIILLRYIGNHYPNYYLIAINRDESSLPYYLIAIYRDESLPYYLIALPYTSEEHNQLDFIISILHIQYVWSPWETVWGPHVYKDIEIWKKYNQYTMTFSLHQGGVVMSSQIKHTHSHQDTHLSPYT